jgi:hypothetical protein
MTGRLASADPELAVRLAVAPTWARAVAALAACRAVVAATGVVDPRVDAALAAAREGQIGESPEHDAVLVLGDELDDAAWTVQEAVDQGLADQADFEAAFARARAVTAVDVLLDGEPDGPPEAIYEALYATDDVDALRRAVLDALAGADKATDPPLPPVDPPNGRR